VGRSQIIVERPAETRLVRIHRRIHDVLHFPGDGQGRFDAPQSEFGTCYFGDTLACSFLEALIRGSRHRVVARADIEVRAVATLRLVRSLRLFMLHSEGLVLRGLPADFPHRDPYTECQNLAVEVWHERGVDGIEYRCRWDDSLLCTALFDRARDALRLPGESVPLYDLARLRPVLRTYEIGVVLTAAPASAGDQRGG
jgi:hypothetical protein